MAAETVTVPIDGSTQAGKDPRVEAWIKKFGVTQIEFRAGVSASAFDMPRCMANQARISAPIDEETVEEYARDMRNGDPFPPVVAYERSGLLVTIDGNHRLVASDKSGRPLNVYVISTRKPQLLVIMTYAANVDHGLKSSTEDRLKQALWMVDSEVKVPDIARTLKLTEGEINRAVAARRAEGNAELAGIADTDWWQSIAKTTRAILGRINTNEGLAAAARLAYEAQMSPSAVTELVAAVNPLRSSALQEDYVRAKAIEVADAVQATGAGLVGTAGNRREPTPLGRLRQILTAARPLRSVPAATIAEAVGPAESDRVAEEARVAAQQLLAVAEILER